MTLTEQYIVIDAAINKLPLQARRKPDFAWADMVEGFTEFDFAHFDYRVRPEPPKPREWWLLLHSNSVVHTCFTTYTGARLYRETFHSPLRVVHVREVLP